MLVIPQTNNVGSLSMATAVIQVFEDTAGRWRWHAVNPGNHKIIATSGESFDSEHNAIRAARGAGLALAFAPVKVMAQPRRTHSYVPPLARGRVPMAATPLARGRVPISPIPQVRGRTGPSPLAVALMRQLGQQ